MRKESWKYKKRLNLVMTSLKDCYHLQDTMNRLWLLENVEKDIKELREQLEKGIIL